MEWLEPLLVLNKKALESIGYDLKIEVVIQANDRRRLRFKFFAF